MTSDFVFSFIDVREYREEAIKNEQFRETSNIGYTRPRQNKTKTQYIP
jgi:hypothetical protein